MASSLCKIQIPLRMKGQATCLHHKGRQLERFCKECQEPACIQCSYSVHQEHEMCGLCEIIPQKKQDLRNFIDRTETVDLVQVDQYINSTDTQLKESTSDFEKLANQLTAQRSKLIEELDFLSAQTLSLYKQKEEDNAKLLQTYKQDLEMYSSQLKQRVQVCKTALQSVSDIEIYDAGSEIHSSVTLPDRPNLGTARFIPNQSPEICLKQALGKFDTSGQSHGQTSCRNDWLSAEPTCQESQSEGMLFSPPNAPPVEISSGQGHKHDTRRHSRSSSSSSKQQLADDGQEASSSVQTYVVEEWKSPHFITSVSPTTDGNVWTDDCKTVSDTLILLNKHGKEIQRVQHSAEIKSISLSPTTDTLWACDEENIITELVSGKLVQRFRTDEEPQCICITASDHVLVGLEQCISKFTPFGEMVHTTMIAGTESPLVWKPEKMVECPVTRNVAVADYNIDGDQNRYVVVMDTEFKQLFVYGGEVPYVNQQSWGNAFYPSGVVYDRVGNLIIGDCENCRVLLLSGGGEFLRIIHTDRDWVAAIGINRMEVLWVVHRGHDIKLLQYNSIQHV
ncbi:uncharacterized protein LOC132562558 [Ylistrum balloti]|uniref:uncharacterized protein LOC132562558 n=1 Tax=Ylistrum balloti TaxID=509963 RepID=UPI002905BBA8|nr:uncharacterized protein LOC132562558 [Ylistrum balloti]